MSALPWRPISAYPRLSPGDRGPQVLIAQSDTRTWGIGRLIWPTYLRKPVAIVNGRIMRRPTHFLRVRTPDARDHSVPPGRNLPSAGAGERAGPAPAPALSHPHPLRSTP